MNPPENLPWNFPFLSSILALWDTQQSDSTYSMVLKTTVKRWISEQKWQDLVYLMHTLKLIKCFHYPPLDDVRNKGDLERSICVAHDVHSVLYKALGNRDHSSPHPEHISASGFDRKNPKKLQKEIYESIGSLMKVNSVGINAIRVQLENLTQHRRKLEEELDRLNTDLSAEYAVIQDNVKKELLRCGLTGGWEIESPPGCLSILHGHNGHSARYDGRVHIGLTEGELVELRQEYGEEYGTMRDLDPDVV